jgi:K+-transporting ATPase A subunit
MEIPGQISAEIDTMPTDGPLFIGFLLAVVAIVTLLQYLPALAVGPIRGALPRRPRSDILALVP